MRSSRLFVDDFQPSLWGAHFEVTINGRRAAFLESVINGLLQTGPVGNLITVPIPQDFLGEVGTGHLELRIDDNTTGAGDGYAIDFVKLLIRFEVVNSAPHAVADIFPHFAILPGEENLLVLTANETSAFVVLDGTQSWDP